MERDPETRGDGHLGESFLIFKSLNAILFENLYEMNQSEEQKCPDRDHSKPRVKMYEFGWV